MTNKNKNPINRPLTEDEKTLLLDRPLTEDERTLLHEWLHNNQETRFELDSNKKPKNFFTKYLYKHRKIPNIHNIITRAIRRGEFYIEGISAVINFNGTKYQYYAENVLPKGFL